MSDERGTSDDSTRFTARPGASDETRFTGAGAAPPPTGGGPSHTTFPPGSLIGHTYRIEALLARGGMGEVYRARHVELNTEHALKIILPELANNQRIVDLFRREASVLRTIRHDAVVAYDGVSRDENGRLYLVMEFADGPSLSKLMHERRLDADEVRQLRDRLADGLAMAHDKGVVHRDISPDNVILPGGDLGKAKIIDFGISKAVDPEVKTIIGDDFAGKFSYVSPEQLGMFGGQIDGRSDIYSLGLVLAAAALGEPLDMGLSPISVIEARRSVPDLSRVPAAVRADLAAMLQPDPAKRPQSMREMIRPQDQRGGRRSTSSDASRPSSAVKQRSGRIGAVVGALAVLVIAGGALGYWYWKGRPEPDHTTATQQADNGVQQSGASGASNAGAADTSSGAVQGMQQSTTSATANQTQTSAPATSAESTGAGTAGTQQLGAATGATSSSAATETADGGQASASNATTPASSGDQSGAASSDGTAAGAATGQSQSQQDNASAVTVPTGTGQTAGGTASSSQQQASNGSTSIVTPSANGQQSSATTATTVTSDQSTTKSSTTADTVSSTTATQATGATNDATLNAAGAMNSSGTSTAAGTAATGTQTALLPQVPDVAKLRSQAQKAVGSLACAGVLVDVSAQGDIAASGFVGSEADRASAAAALAALPQVGRVDNAIEVQTPPLCEVLGVLQGVALNIGGPSAPRIDPGGPYHEGKDPLNLTVTPPRDGYLYVDYIDAANEDPKQRYVLHLLPSPLRDPNNHVKAGAPVVIGSLPKEKEIYRFNPPLGANMVLVVLSPQPLFPKARPQEEDGDSVGTYLTDLRTALTGVAKRVGPGRLFVGTSKLTFVTE